MVRIAPSDTQPGRLYGYEFIFSKEPPSAVNWDTNWQSPGGGVDGYCTGVEVEYDSTAAKPVTIVRDGGTAIQPWPTDLPATTGRTKARLTWGATRCKTIRMHSSSVAGRLYSWTWLWQPEPPAASIWDSNYENDGSLEDKVMAGEIVQRTDSGGPYLE